MLCGILKEISMKRRKGSGDNWCNQKMTSFDVREVFLYGDGNISFKQNKSLKRKLLRLR